jgi:WD40 repeat protein
MVRFRWDADQGKTVQLWDANHLDKPRAILRGHEDSVYMASFSPDGHRFLTVGYDATRLWDAEHPDLLPVVLRGDDYILRGACFSPENCRILAADGRTARLWETDRPENPPVVLRGHESDILEVCFSPDGRRILTAGADKTVRLWTVHVEDLIHLGGRMVGRNLTRTEWAQHFPGQDYRPTFPQLPVPK